MRHLILAISIAMIFIGNAEAGHKIIPKHPPIFSAKSFLVAEADGTVIKEQNGNSILPIASITKLMVGLLVVEQDLSEFLSIPTFRQVHSSIPKTITTLRRKELLILALVKSDNFAAQILCNNMPNCIASMNNKAKELGMTDTQYHEPTGLDNRNVSTARDLLKLMIAASVDPVISNISSMPKAEIAVDRKFIKINNTNPLISKFRITLSKTGYTRQAGGCLVIILNSVVGQRILILLGSRNTKTRILDMEKLVKEL